MKRDQSEQSKLIKRINEQIKQLYKFIPSEDNNYLSAYYRAIDNAGLETSYNIVNGEKVEVIRNTAANREKAAILMRELHDRKSRSMREIREAAKKAVKERGQKVTKQNIESQLAVMSAYASLESNLDFVYKSGDPDLIQLVDEMAYNKRSGRMEDHAKLALQLANEVRMARQEERDMFSDDIYIDPEDVF